MVSQLVTDHSITSVVSLNEDFELEWASLLMDGMTGRDWKHLNVDFLQLPTPDILHAPDGAKLEQGVKYLIEKSTLKNENQSKTFESFGVNRTSLAGRFVNKLIHHDGLPLIQLGTTQEAPTSSVYVHCKAGRTRSATLVACYLIKVRIKFVLVLSSYYLNY